MFNLFTTRKPISEHCPEVQNQLSSSSFMNIGKLSKLAFSLLYLSMSTLTGCYKLSPSPRHITSNQEFNRVLKIDGEKKACNYLFENQIETGSLLFYTGQCLEKEHMFFTDPSLTPVYFYQKGASCGELKSIEALKELGETIPEIQHQLGKWHYERASVGTTLQLNVCGFTQRPTIIGYILIAPLAVVAGPPIILYYSLVYLTYKP